MSVLWPDGELASHPISGKSIIPSNASFSVSRIMTIALPRGDLTRTVTLHSLLYYL